VGAMPTKMLVAADTVAFRSVRPGDLDVLLVERANEPFRGCWALPGGFVEEDEDLPQAAARELSEETGLAPAVMDQVGAWGTPGRDPRGRVVSAVYLAVARPGQDRAEGGDDAARAAWHPVDGLPHLAFDHAEIVPGTCVGSARGLTRRSRSSGNRSGSRTLLRCWAPLRQSVLMFSALDTFGD